MQQHQVFQYLYQAQWIPEGSTHQFPPITLYDDAGAVLSTVTDLFLTLRDRSGTDNAIVNSVEHLSIKATNPRSRLISGVLTLTLAPTIATAGDTAILVATRAYEIRRAILQYTFGSGGTKSDVIIIDFIVTNIAGYPYVTP